MSHIRQLISLTSRALAGLVCPPECVWCHRPIGDGFLCASCLERFQKNYYCCQKCATPLPAVVRNEDCFRCRDMKWKFQRTIALGPYRGQLREAVILMKKSGAETLRNALGRLLGKQLRNLVNSRTTAEPRHVPDPILVPVPNHWTHGLSRAANTAGSIAAAVASETGYPVADRAIRRIRKTSKQGMLAWTERAKNVRHAFQISNAKLLIERHVILVDDVLTSGATVGELARVLHRVGISSLDVAVVARGTGSRESSPATARPDHAG